MLDLYDLPDKSGNQMLQTDPVLLPLQGVLSIRHEALLYLQQNLYIL